MVGDTLPKNFTTPPSVLDSVFGSGAWAVNWILIVQKCIPISEAKRDF